MIGKRDEFWGGFEIQTALKLRWRRAADCSRGGIRQPEMHDHQQWTAVYVRSLAMRMTTTGDGDGWKRRRSGCCRKDTVEPGRAGIGRWAQLTLNRYVPETAASVGLSQHWCDVLITRRSMYQSGGGVENRLKSTELRRRKSCEWCVAVVETSTRPANGTT